MAGEMEISGSKNAVFPLIAACLLSAESCVLERVPAIQDVEIMLEIAAGLGVRVEWDRERHHLMLDASHLSGYSPDPALSRKFRGSVLFAGALLGRVRRAEIPFPGGDAIGARPLTTNFHAFEELALLFVKVR